MKKSIQIIGMLAITLVTFFACKKNEVEPQKEDRFSVNMQVAIKGGEENAVIIGTKAELKAALTEKEKTVYLKKVSINNNVFIPIVGPVKDPNGLCWDEINAYVDAHRAEWQATANQNCQTILVCVTCPNSGGGLYIMYAFKPTSPKCMVYEQFEMQYSLAAFNFGDNELESEAIANFIKRR
ncbi:hypothetical protein [Nubsella zeaxanthinifaciens]|uniref:hypothetical protein n=1 Tax=Nubsella zeaxanthinifaciens TaxID=392412 RepID=UPI000DE2E0FD|nr:hypothetical protein [Nubsella zeaxanthinifaciens]